ncbi:alpha 1,2-mannosyltransferase 2.4.1 [Borealophlyctis nickersoniae]|nr:alpha 1,2-mannosyltransferase 2.4.1 [Borealophlyctis nickersoniae]
MALAAKLLRNRFARQAGVVLITIWALWYLAAVLGQRRPNPPSTSSQSEGRPSTASPPPQLAKPKTFLDESVAGTTGGGKAGAGGKNRQNDDKKVGNGGVGQAPKNSKLGGGVKEEKAGAAAAGAGADVGVGGLKTGPIGSSPKQEQGPGGSVNSEKGGKQRVGGPSVVHGGGANVPIDANSLRKGLGLDRILPLPEPQKGASLVPVESIKTNPSDRANAAIVILCRNKDLKDMKSTLRQFEDRFNRRYSYPYVFLNDEPFTEQFQEHIRRLTDAKVEFGVVEPHTWRYPDWINATMAEQCMDKMEKDGIIYGVAKYEWYWRVEPGVSFFCDIPYDPFVFMQENKKSYGFVISLLEIRQTIPSLWGLTRHHAFAKGLGRNDTKLLRFFADEEGDYNGCHFWLVSPFSLRCFRKF